MLPAPSPLCSQYLPPPAPPPPRSPFARSVSAYVPDETGKATLQLKRNEYLVNKHINGWLDRPEGEEKNE